MDDFPQAPTEIRVRLQRYERALRREQASYGFINDGGSKRYLLVRVASQGLRKLV